MLIEFRLKNFLSFRDECVFSMVAGKDDSLSEGNVIPVPQFGGRRLLRSAAIYGANASGKSNLIEAFVFVQAMVNGSLRKGKTVIPFLLDEQSVREPSEFEVTFIEQGIRYQYGFILDSKKVHKEWLFAFPKGQPQKWFTRSLDQDGESDWEWGSQLKGEKQRLADMTRPDALFLSVAARFNQKQLQPVYDWFVERLAIVKAQHFSELYTLNRLEEDGHFKTLVESLLQMADLGVSEITVKKEVIEPDSLAENIIALVQQSLNKDSTTKKPEFTDMELPKPSLLHRTPSGKDILLPYELESEGTKRILQLAIAFIDTLETGMVLAVDEFDSSLHPLIVRSLVEIFHDPELNKNNAQLIFNTHDTTLLSQDLFRRDQIWLTEKDSEGASNLYSLLEFKPRKSEALEKGYLQGRYGAIPVLTGYPGLLVGE